MLGAAGPWPPTPPPKGLLHGQGEEDVACPCRDSLSLWDLHHEEDGAGDRWS